MARIDYTLVEQQAIHLPPDALDTTTAALLHRHYARQIEVEPPSFKTGNQWRLTAQGWAGWLPLTSKVGFVIQPKVPLLTLFRMLEVAYDLAALQFLPGLVQVVTLPELYSRLAHLLAQRVLHRSRKGLYHAYVPRDDALPLVRGRIQPHRLGSTVATAALPCTYGDLTADVDDNRILAWTLHRLAQSDLCTGAALTQVRRAARLLAGQVTLTPMHTTDCLGRTYTRLNQDYAPLHALCAFFLDQCGPGHLAGDRPMLPFLVDMARLYERFVAAWLAQRLHTQYHVSAQVPTPVGGDLRFTIDLLISDPQRRWVVDTKYKLPRSGPDAADVAQVLAYAQVTGAHQAVLVYPAALPQPLDTTLQGIRLRTLTFALDRDLDAAGEDFVAALFHPSPAPGPRR